MDAIIVKIDAVGRRTARLSKITWSGTKWCKTSDGEKWNINTGIKFGQSAYQYPERALYENTEGFYEAMDMHEKGGGYWRVEGL